MYNALVEESSKDGKASDVDRAESVEDEVVVKPGVALFGSSLYANQAPEATREEIMKIARLRNCKADCSGC